MNNTKERGHIAEKTAKFIKNKTKETKPGAYTEQPKTHKFEENVHDMKAGFPATGIISCKNTPTEALQDYVDFLVNPAMKKQQSYIKDTKHVLQKVQHLNEEGKLNDQVNLVTADFQNMYGKVPLELSTEGIREFCQKEGFNEEKDKPNTVEVLEALNICQTNNVFEFNGLLYKQKKGHATGQKQAPPVACAGVGLAEQEWLSIPEVAELFDEYGRYIDDILSLFHGDQRMCDWAFQQFNNLYPGDLILTWEWSNEKVIFLNLELIINREKNLIETKYYVKPTNQRLFLNYRSNHPRHVFLAVVYGMALQGLMVNSRLEWNIEYLVALREKFLQQEYPLEMINSQLKRP